MHNECPPRPCPISGHGRWQHRPGHVTGGIGRPMARNTGHLACGGHAVGPVNRASVRLNSGPAKVMRNSWRDRPLCLQYLIMKQDECVVRQMDSPVTH